MIETYLKEIGLRLKEVRKSLNLTQEKLKEETGLSIGFISGIETGKKRPSSILLFYLAHRYNVNINYLLTGKGDRIFKESYLEKSRHIDFGRDKHVIEELLYYLEHYDLARYSILTSFLKFKKENPGLSNQEE